jgi:cytochrome c-type biogenesis protein CcmH/NrfG
VFFAKVSFCSNRDIRAGAAINRRPCPARLILITSVCVLALCSKATGQIATHPQNDLVAQASAARSENDVPRAIELYSEAVKENPKWPDGWWFLGSLQYGTGAYLPARDALSHYIEMIPNAGPAFALRGLCEFEIAEYPKALADIQHGISLGAANEPRNAQILRYHEALLLTHQAEYAAALKAYSFFAKHSITNPELLTAIGLAGLRMPLLPKDVAAEQQTLVSEAGDAAYRYLAGDEASASQAFQELFQRFPAAPNAHFLYGYLLFATNPDAALAEFRQELRISPSNADADVMTAWAFLIKNAATEALPFARKAAELDPTVPSAQLVLGKSLLETGELNGGMEHLEKALQLEPGNLETHLALAKAYSKSGRKEDARRERIFCLRLTSGNDPTIEHP